MSTETGETLSWVSAEVRRLRAKAGLQKKELAALMDMVPSSWQHYEDRHKGPYFEPEIVRRLVDVLVPRGVDRESVLALGGPLPIADYAADKLDELAGTAEQLARDLYQLKRSIKPNS